MLGKPQMSNDADQKVKWREWWILQNRCNLPLRVFNCWDQATNHIEPNDNLVHIIEAAPALAEIEKLRADLALGEESSLQVSIVLKAEIDKLRTENTELKRRISGHMGAVDIFCERNDKLQSKLSAATAQMEKLADWLVLIAAPSVFNCAIGEGNQRAAATKAIAQYEQFKKELNNT